MTNDQFSFRLSWVHELMARGGHGFLFRMLSFGDAANNHIKNRREKNSDQGNAQHPAKHRSSEDPAHFSAGALREHEGDDTEDEGERGHQNWPQAQTAGFDSGFDAAKPGVLPLLCELHNKNGVFAGETHQQNEAYLREDIVFHMTKKNTCKRKQYAKGHDQDDGQ